MATKRTIRDIQLPKKSTPKSTDTKPKKTSATASTSGRGGYTSSYKEATTSSASPKGWLIAVTTLAIGVLVIWTMAARAEVVIVPKTADGANGGLAMTAQAQAGQEDLRYEIVRIEDTLSESLSATGSSTAEERASGTIVVYNEGSAPQTLTEETRFESSNGLIYKTAPGASITIPGASGETPGSLEVMVYAEKPGVEYNIDLDDFVIPGWREAKSHKFETQYARSKTPMTGGFVGERPQVSDEELALTKNRLRATLEARLEKELIANVPEAYVVFPGAIAFSYTSEPLGEIGEGSRVNVSETASATAVIFERKELSTALAEQLLAEYDGQPVMVENFDELSFTTSANITTFGGGPLPEEVSFTITGAPHFVWQNDDLAITEALTGKHKKEFDTTISAFPGIARAELSMSPVWKQKIPAVERIQIVDHE